MKAIILGDVVGRPGRTVLNELLKRLRDEHEAEFVVANVENAAAGAGIIPRVGEEILQAGVDVMTSGNHVFDKKDALEYIEKNLRLLRPANYPPDSPGRGVWLGSTVSGTPVAVINIQGRVFMPPNDCPFRTVDRLVTELRSRATVLIVDHHAEATSEKVAMGRYLDGRVSVVVGTHTHVQTSDAGLLPRGTAFITDAGMTGPHDSVIGVEAELAIRRMRTGLPVRFETARGGVRIEGALIECDAETGKASSIEAVRVPFP